MKRNEKWNEYDAFIRAGRFPNRGYRKVANNTVAIRRGDNIAVRLHQTDVLMFTRETDEVTFNDGGWVTSTTKARMSEFGPTEWAIWQTDGIWTLARVGIGQTGLDPARHRYFDGMRLDIGHGRIVNAANGPDFANLDKTNAATRRAITKYVRGLTDETIETVLASDGAGDCFGCHFGFSGNDHLFSHLEESYYMVHLIYNAYVSRGYVDPALVMRMDAGYPKRMRETVGKYLRANLLEKVATR